MLYEADDDVARGHVRLAVDVDLLTGRLTVPDVLYCNPADQRELQHDDLTVLHATVARKLRDVHREPREPRPAVPDETVT